VIQSDETGTSVGYRVPPSVQRLAVATQPDAHSIGEPDPVRKAVARHGNDDGNIRAQCAFDEERKALALALLASEPVDDQKVRALIDSVGDLDAGVCTRNSNYKSVELPPELSVGSEYGLTVSRNAAPGASDFAMYLLSPQGQSSLKSFGFIPVTLPAPQ
jgi:hypothetical protein